MRTYIVTGMGRSGTSFLAKSLHDQGVHMGDELETDTHTGGYEHPTFLNINKDIITAAGGAWGLGALPVAEEKIIAVGEQFAPRIRQAIESSKREAWGFKEPRLSLTLRVLMPHILEVDDDPFLYVCFRKPEKVAQSLHRLAPANWMIERGVKVAKETNRRLLAYLAEFLEL